MPLRILIEGGRDAKPLCENCSNLCANEFQGGQLEYSCNAYERSGDGPPVPLTTFATKCNSYSMKWSKDHMRNNTALDKAYVLAAEGEWLSPKKRLKKFGTYNPFTHQLG